MSDLFTFGSRVASYLAETTHPNSALIANKQILRTDVPMNNAMLMEIIQAKQGVI